MHLYMRWFSKKREKTYSRSAKKRKNFFEKKEKPDKKVFLKLLFRALLFAFAAATAYILFFSPLLEVNRILIKGNSELSAREIESIVQENIQGRYLKIAPKNNLILASSARIRSNLLNSFKKLSGVEVKKIFPDAIEISVQERKSLLIWCAAGPCYIVDENGYAYTGADFEAEEIKQNNLVTAIDTSAKPVSTGEKVLDPSYIQFISNIKDELEKKTGIKIAGEYKTGSRMAEEVNVRTEAGWEIYFSSSLPLDASLRTLSTFLEKETAVKTDTFEYIDLRAESKVYYKLKETQTDADETQTSAEPAKTGQTDTGTKKDTKKKK